MRTILPKIKKNCNPEDYINRKNLSSTSAFLGLGYEPTAFLAGCVFFSQKNKRTTLVNIIENLSPIIPVASLVKAFIQLTGMGYLEINPSSFEDAHVDISLNGNLEVALRMGKIRVLQLQRIQLDCQDIELLELYAYAICFLCRYISLSEWERFCFGFMRKTEHPLGVHVRLLKTARIDKAATLFACLIHMMSNERIDLLWLSELFSANLIQRARLHDKWNLENSALTSSGLLKMQERSNGKKVLFCSMKLSDPGNCKDANPDEWNAEESKPALTIIKHDSIAVHKLIYNQNLQARCEELFKLLSYKNFKSYQDQMLKRNQYPGIAILLTGQPGTGKTELTRQLARETKRDLLMFEVSEQRDMFFGESEKKIKEVFTFYQSRSKDSAKTPVLCFNEADSLFQIRKDNSYNTSQTENAVQTILLNEMEKFTGIMICTTNVPQLFDEAYTRRFLYRIEIEMPDAGARLQLLNHYFPHLHRKHKEEFAEAYTFSGAQLNNFMRRETIESIIYPVGKPFELKLREYLRTELSVPSGKHKPIRGFKPLINENMTI